jgi:hypothetical protein
LQREKTYVVGTTEVGDETLAPIADEPKFPHPTSPNAHVRLHRATPGGHQGPPLPICSSTTTSHNGDAMFTSSPIFAVYRSPNSIVVAGRCPSNSFTPAVGPISGRWSCSGQTHVLDTLLLPRQEPAAARLAPWRCPPNPLDGCRAPSGQWSFSGRTHVTETHPPPSPNTGGRSARSVVSWGSLGREVQ